MRPISSDYGQRPSRQVKCIPGFSAPQHSQCKIFFAVPLEAGRRLPQSVQKIKEPIAAMVPSPSQISRLEIR